MVVWCALSVPGSIENLDRTSQESGPYVWTSGGENLLYNLERKNVLTVDIMTPLPSSFSLLVRPELVSVMTAIGNETSWKILEAKATKAKPNPNSSV